MIDINREQAKKLIALNAEAFGQAALIVEETSELIKACADVQKAISKRRRHKMKTQDVVDECYDVITVIYTLLTGLNIPDETISEVVNKNIKQAILSFRNSHTGV